MSGYDLGPSTSNAQGGSANASTGSASAPGKQTRVEQAGGEASAATAGPGGGTTGAAAPAAAGRPSLHALFGAKPKPQGASAPAAAGGPGPRNGLGPLARGIAGARTPRQLARAVPPAVLAQHGLTPPAAAAPRGAAALPAGGAVQRKVVQFDVRGEVDQQRNKRGVDTPQGGSGGQHGSFQDQAPDDHGPTLHHDHGFLDDGSGNIDESLRQDPTWADRVERLKWIAKLEAAELLRPDLVDGTAAYRHFLFGGGAARDVQYGRFLANDSSGQTVLASAMEDTRQAAIERHDRDVAGATPTEGTQSYHIRTNPISVTTGDARYPYPATENWQKAIGAHSIWIEANVTVTVARIRDATGERSGGVPEPGEGSSTESGPPTFTRHFHVEMTIHAEDMYNFNPNNFDIATGTPDAANGRFEITGLGHEYLNRGTFSQPFDFDATMDPASSPASSTTPNDPGRASRSGRPADRRGYPTTR